MTFYKPGELQPETTVLDREAEAEGNVVVYNRNANLSINQQRVRLPIYQNKIHILYLLENYPTVIIVGSTGSGKTTQIPQYLDENGWTADGKLIGCTQPRRVAATSVATRVAEEMGVKLGEDVGYTIRFDDKSSPKTRIKYLTDGMLLREMMLDPLLSKYSVIMLDEAHERSLYTDILVGLIKKVQRKRKDLRIIISSATVDAEEFKEFFTAPTNGVNPKLTESVSILSIEGRQYPVEIFYTKTPVTDYLQSAFNTVIEIHRREPAGDILVFLTGQEEIDTLVKLLKDRDQSGASVNPNMTMQVLPLYAGLTNDQQMKVFKSTPQSVRKVVVATNIAETSVTIEGVVYVIDCGFVKIRAYNPKSGLESLVVVPESQSSANQRAGRAGRVRPGKCYRLFTEDAFHELAVKTVPEMQRSNLAMIVIQLKAMGIDNVLQFDFMSPPPAESMIRALELLYALNALDDSAKLTESIGSKMAEFPIEPTLAKMLLTSAEYGCSEEMVTIAAMLTVQSVFVYPKDARKKADAIRRQFAVKEGDHLTLLNVFVSYMDNRRDTKWCHSRYLNAKALDRAFEIRKQLVRYLRRFKVPLVSAMGDVEKIIKALISGYFANAARLEPDGQCYRTIRQNHKLNIHPNSVLFRTPPQWVIFSEVVLTSKEFMREVTAIKAQWLADIAPHFYDFKQAPTISNINRNIEENIAKSTKDTNTSGGVLNYSPF